MFLYVVKYVTNRESRFELSVHNYRDGHYNLKLLLSNEICHVKVKSNGSIGAD